MYVSAIRLRIFGPLSSPKRPWGWRQHVYSKRRNRHNHTVVWRRFTCLTLLHYVPFDTAHEPKCGCFWSVKTNSTRNGMACGKWKSYKCGRDKTPISMSVWICWVRVVMWVCTFQDQILSEHSVMSIWYPGRSRSQDATTLKGNLSEMKIQQGEL